LGWISRSVKGLSGPPIVRSSQSADARCRKPLPKQSGELFFSLFWPRLSLVGPVWWGILEAYAWSRPYLTAQQSLPGRIGRNRLVTGRANQCPQKARPVPLLLGLGLPKVVPRGKTLFFAGPQKQDSTDPREKAGDPHSFRQFQGLQLTKLVHLFDEFPHGGNTAGHGGLLLWS